MEGQFVSFTVYCANLTSNSNGSVARGPKTCLTFSLNFAQKVNVRVWRDAENTQQILREPLGLCNGKTVFLISSVSEFLNIL